MSLVAGPKMGRGAKASGGGRGGRRGQGDNGESWPARRWLIISLWKVQAMERAYPVEGRAEATASDMVI